MPVRVKKTRQNKGWSLGSDSIRTYLALSAEQFCRCRAVAADQIEIFRDRLWPPQQVSLHLVAGFTRKKIQPLPGLPALRQPQQIQPTRSPDDGAHYRL